MKWIAAVVAALATAACLVVGYQDEQRVWQEQQSALGTLVSSDREAVITGVLPSPQDFAACSLASDPPCVTLTAVATTVDAASTATTAEVAVGALLSTTAQPEPSAYSDATAGAPSAVHARYGAAAQPPVTSGRPPAGADELAVSAPIARQAGLGLGDTATLTTADGGEADFTVVGLLPGGDRGGAALWAQPLESAGWPYLATLDGLARLQGAGGAPVVVTYAWDGDAAALGDAVPEGLAHAGFEGPAAAVAPWPLVGLAAVAALGLWFVAHRSLKRRAAPAKAPWASWAAGSAAGAAAAYGATWWTSTRLRDAHAEFTVAATASPPWAWLALGVAGSAAAAGLVVVIASGLERPARTAGTPDGAS